MFFPLKKWWAILKKKIDIKLENIPKVVYTCFILQNFCETRKGTFNSGENKSQAAAAAAADDDDDDDYHHHQAAEISNNMSRNNGPDNIYSANSDEGYVLRKIITNYI